MKQFKIHTILYSICVQKIYPFAVTSYLVTNNKLIFVFDVSDKLFKKGSAYFSGQFCLHLEKLTEFFVKSACKQGDFHPFFKKGSICRMQVKKKKKSRRGQSNDLTRVFWPDVVITVLSSGFEDYKRRSATEQKINVFLT